MGRKSNSASSTKSTSRSSGGSGPGPGGKGKDNGKKFKKKVCIFCKEHVDFIDYKDANLLRRFMSDRAKIRARRTTGNCAQHQRDVALAIKLSRELALLPYATRVTSSRGGGRGGPRGRDRDDRPPRPDSPPPQPGAGPDSPSNGVDADGAVPAAVGASFDGDGGANDDDGGDA